MSSRRGFNVFELMIVVVIIGMLAAIAIPKFINMQSRAKEASVKTNCHTVQLAAEDFYVQNDGVYATSVMDKLPNGTKFIDLLPGGHLLENPFTKSPDSPVDLNGEWPLMRGQVGYESLDKNGDGVIDGYKVIGHGRDGVITTLKSVD